MIAFYRRAIAMLLTADLPLVLTEFHADLLLIRQKKLNFTKVISSSRSRHETWSLVKFVHRLNLFMAW